MMIIMMKKNMMMNVDANNDGDEATVDMSRDSEVKNDFCFNI